MRYKRYKNGFTLVELLVALAVSSIVLAAVATLAFAMGKANQTSDDTSQKQAQLRYANLRISQLLRHCKLICGTPGNDLAVWRSDENDDGHINAPELVYIETGSSTDYIRILEFTNVPAWLETSVIDPDNIQDGSAKSGLKSSCEERYTTLIPQCSNVQFNIDSQPLRTQFVSISFDLSENDVVHKYQINSRLRSWAGNLINDSGDIIVSDDD